MFRRFFCPVLLCYLMLVMLIPAASAYTRPNVSSRSAFVIDAETGSILFSKDPDTLRAPASMTKIMTAYILFEEVESGNLNWDANIRISQNASNVSNRWDYIAHFRTVGAHLSAETMLRLILIPSHNGACVAVAEHISGSESAFVQRMNETAERIGMAGRFDNSHGVTGNALTARSVAILVRHFIERFPDVLQTTGRANFAYGRITINNTNRLLRAPVFSGADGFKTGTTSAAGHCLSFTAVQNGRRVIGVIMNAPNDTARYNDTRALLNFGFAELIRRDDLLNAITIDIHTDVNEARRNDYLTLTATLGNINTENHAALGGGWIINGGEAETFDSFLPRDMREFALTRLVPINNTETEIAAEFFINLPANGRISRVINVPVSSESPQLFRDIYGHPEREQILRANELGLMQGDGTGRFLPENALTRAVLIQMLYNIKPPEGPLRIGNTVFSDVSPDAWYAKSSRWAWYEGIIVGWPGNRFAPREPVSRESLAIILDTYIRHIVGEDIEISSIMQIDEPGGITRARAASILLNLVEAISQSRPPFAV